MNLKEYFGDEDPQPAPSTPTPVSDKPWGDWATFVAGPVVPLRVSLKRQLMTESSGHLVCPFCIYRAGNVHCIKGTSGEMHEIFCPRIKGGKYVPKSGDPIARAVYVLENLILACHTCNMNWLNGQDRAWVLSIKMGMPGYPPERVLPKILDLARQLTCPNAIIPYHLFDAGERCFKLDFKTYTYTGVNQA